MAIDIERSAYVFVPHEILDAFEADPLLNEHRRIKMA
jgi:hypothetical protein